MVRRPSRRRHNSPMKLIKMKVAGRLSTEEIYTIKKLILAQSTENICRALKSNKYPADLIDSINAVVSQGASSFDISFENSDSSDSGDSSDSNDSGDHED